MSTTTSPTPHSRPFVLITIPLYFLLSLLPHFYSIYLISSARKQPKSTTSSKQKPTFDAANPRSQTLDAHLASALSLDTYARYTRSRSAHSNTLENLSITVAGVLVAAFHPSLSSTSSPSYFPFSSSSSSASSSPQTKISLAEYLCYLGLFLRAVYMLVYIFLLEGPKAKRLVVVRTTVWAVSLSCYLAVVGMGAYS